MKTITHVIFAVAPSLLHCYLFNNQRQSTDKAATGTDSPSVTSERLPIAYIDNDSLLAKYNYAKDLSESLMRRMENENANFNEKARQLQNDKIDFQRKLQNNAFLSQERAEQEAQRIARKEADLQKLGQQKEQELMLEQQKTLMAVSDSINSFIKEYNKTKKYQAILYKAATIYIDESYNITDEVVDMLNKRYNPAKK
ncbi:MAG: OmpH family outer membrane protein [Barnesiella sp.]